MKEFTTEDFSGCGQYLIRMGVSEIAKRKKGEWKNYLDTGFLSTIMYKVGFMTNIHDVGNGEQLVTLVSMADGLTKIGAFTDRQDNQGNRLPTEKQDFIYWQKSGESCNLTAFCNFLNHKGVYRLATHEEVIRVVSYQKNRCK